MAAGLLRGGISSANSDETWRDASAQVSLADDHHDLEDRRAPTIKLDEEQAIVVCEPDPTAHFALQYNRLLS